MMKVLLINPPIENMIKNVPSEVIEGRDVGFPNLGIMYIASYLEENSPNNDVEILDAQIERIDYENLERRIERIAPDVVGVPTTSFTLIDALQTARTVKKIDKDIKVVFGGRHPTIYPKETANFPEIDFVVIGESEITFTKLIENINNKKEKLKKIRGLAFKKESDDEVIYTGPPKTIMNLDELPFPSRDLTPYKKYKYSLGKGRIFTTLMTSRGCPYNCLFCDKSQGDIIRVRSPVNVVDEMEECLNMGIEEIFIHDDTFTANKKRVIDICDEIKRRDLNLVLSVRTRVDLVDSELMKKLKFVGCERIQYGIESGNEKILKRLRKGITKEQVRNAVKIAKYNNIEVLSDFMIGSPGERKEEIDETIKFALELDIDYAYFSITTPYPSTDLYREGIDNGIFDDYWKKFATNPSKEFKIKFWTENLSEDEIRGLLVEAYRRFYRRPTYILKKILKVKSFIELKEDMKIGLEILRM